MATGSCRCDDLARKLDVLLAGGPPACQRRRGLEAVGVGQQLRELDPVGVVVQQGADHVAAGVETR